MMDISYHLYDTAVFSNTVVTTHRLFQVVEGGDTIHTSDFTNMRGAGQLPGSETFKIRKVSVAFESNIVEADVEDWFVNGFLKLTYNNLVMLQSPLLPLIDYSAYSGQYTQAAAATRALIGRWGSGYMLDPMITIKGNTGFDIQLFQGTVLATASMKVKCILEGILSRPEPGT